MMLARATVFQRRRASSMVPLVSRASVARLPGSRSHHVGWWHLYTGTRLSAESCMSRTAMRSYILRAQALCEAGEKTV